MNQPQIRNIAIIAHVDHGKTTLIDGMLKRTATFRSNQSEMTQTTILDANDLEREKGITILAKNTAVAYHDPASNQEYKINIIDTPGHADFAGEVERVISMADGAILLVDAAEGPLPQTRFVLEQALKQHLKVMVILNKIDRQDADPDRVLHQVEELFLNLVEDEAQLAFPVLYAVGRDEKVWSSRPTNASDPGDLQPLFHAIIEHMPAPTAQIDAPFKLQVSALDFDTYKGTYAIGKVTQGQVKQGQRLVVLDENDIVTEFNVAHLLTSKGLEREEIAVSQAGDIIAITGLDSVAIGQTLAELGQTQGFTTITLTEPTLKIKVAANTSPFAGREGEFSTIRQIAERLNKEQKTNIGLRIEPMSGGAYAIAGRGELHLSVLIETMRREGYEMEVSRPEVIFKEIDGQTCEPLEELTIEIEQSLVGVIIEEMGQRQARLIDSHTDAKGVSHMKYHVTSRNLLGFRTQVLSKTRGNGLFNSRFSHYVPLQSLSTATRNGAMVATEGGMATSYAIEAIQQRGQTFVNPGDKVYQGQIIGLRNQQDDIDVNICKQKKLTNHRSATADILKVLNASLNLSLEQCFSFINDDELLEVTPQNLRLRKKVLDKTYR